MVKAAGGGGGGGFLFVAVPLLYSSVSIGFVFEFLKIVRFGVDE